MRPPTGSPRRQTPPPSAFMCRSPAGSLGHGRAATALVRTAGTHLRGTPPLPAVSHFLAARPRHHGPPRCGSRTGHCGGGCGHRGGTFQGARRRGDTISGQPQWSGKHSEWASRRTAAAGVTRAVPCPAAPGKALGGGRVHARVRATQVAETGRDVVGSSQWALSRLHTCLEWSQGGKNRVDGGEHGPPRGRVKRSRRREGRERAAS